jgi:hypothetical protein
VIPGDRKKLLGGYATGTLTAEERQALFEAALEDQGLFDALAREEALREVLVDGVARARLLAALEGQRAPWWRRAWVAMPVRALAATAALSIAVVAGYWVWHSQPRHAVTEVAALRPAATPAAPPAAIPEKSVVSAPAAKEPRALMRRLPAESDRVRQNALGSRQAQAVAQTGDAGASGGGGGGSRVIGSLTPAPPLAGFAPAPAAAPMPKEAVAVGARPEASQMKAEAQTSSAGANSADSALVVNGSAAPILQSGSAGNNFRPARAPIMSALGALIAAPLRWTVLRRSDGGFFDPIELADLHAGNTIELRLESTVEGDISLSEDAPGGKDAAVLLPATHIVPGQALVTPPIAPSSAAARILTMRLTRAQTPPISIDVRLNYR